MEETTDRYPGPEPGARDRFRPRLQIEADVMSHTGPLSGPLGALLEMPSGIRVCTSRCLPRSQCLDDSDFFR